MAQISPETNKRLMSLIEFAKTADLEEVVWEKGSTRIAFRRNVNGAGPGAENTSSATAPASEVENPAPVAKIHAVLSPIVGTFWRSVSQDRPPLVVDGDEIKPGQRLGFVEAMKVQKEVISDVAGRITKILVQNGKPAEYGQKIFEVEVKN